VFTSNERKKIAELREQGAYNSGKPGNLREFVNSGKLREFKIYSENLYDTISWASSCVHNCQ